MIQQKFNQLDLSALIRLMAVMSLLIFVLAGCSGTPQEPDGDDEKDNWCDTKDDCQPCYTCFNNECVPDFADPNCVADGDPEDADDDKTDGDLTDNETTETDGDDPDGDLCEVDCDGDGDLIEAEEAEGPCTKDEDCGENQFCYIPTGICIDKAPDGDIERPEDDLCECTPGDDFLCPADSYCGDDCMCHPIEEDTECGGESYGDCTTHTDCPRGILCNTECGICDLETTDASCTTADDCNVGLHCVLGKCEVECIPDIKYCPDDDDCCTDDGYCRAWACLEGDSDEEEEEWHCGGCDDCKEHPDYGEGYYCSFITKDCTPMQTGDGVDACCADADCVVQSTGICDIRIGLCRYVADPINRGSISGTVYFSELIYNMGNYYDVVLKDNAGQELERDSNRLPENTGGEYKFSYVFDRLNEDSFNVFLEIGDTEIANPFNPILIEFDDINIEKMIREDVDFYLGVEDPRLATVSGKINILEDDGYEVVNVELFKENPANGELEIFAEEVTGPQGTLQRDYSITGVVSGTYLARATLRDELIDYYSTRIIVDIDNDPTLAVNDIDFYFDDILRDHLSHISGTVYFAQYLDISDLSVNLYSRFGSDQYPMSEASISNIQDDSFDYDFLNLEAGSFLISADVEYDGYSYVAYPLPVENASLDIEAGNQIVAPGRDIYVDAVNPDYCSISGSVKYSDLISAGDIVIEVHDSNAFGNLLIADPVLDVQDNIGQFFIEGLDAGTYYIKAVKADDSTDFVVWNSGITVMTSGGTKDADGILFDFLQ